MSPRGDTQILINSSYSKEYLAYLNGNYSINKIT